MMQVVKNIRAIKFSKDAIILKKFMISELWNDRSYIGIVRAG
jgi:hypothetical protein